MAQRFSKRLKHAWNAFAGDDRRREPYTEYYGGSTSYRPDRLRMSYSNGKTIITSIYNRIGVDAAGVKIRHVKLDEEGRYEEDVDSGLNNCFTLEANLDQAARAFRQDLIMTMMDRGCAVVVPIDTSVSPLETGGYDIKTVRVGYVVQWYPRHVRVSVYNDAKGMREEITLPKSTVAIIENPLYSVMNEPNSTLQRLISKLSMLDAVDEQSSSGKLDMIIQLPYVVKSDARRQQAEQRRKDVEFQLKGSQYGIAYIDGTEKVTQLNRPAENNLMAQVEYLQEMLYGQLGITAAVMNGTADEPTMLNYWNRTIEPILDAIVEAMRPKFLTKTARSQKQSILYFRDPFKLIPIGGEGGIADIADKLGRNEVVASNEIRQVLGMKPSKDPKADELINSNMPQADTGVGTEESNVVPITAATK